MATAPRLDGIVESSLYVEDLERSREFYRQVLEFPVLFSDGRLAALDVAGRQILLLFRTGASAEPSETPGGLIPGHDARGRIHLAFAVPEGELDRWEERLRENAVTITSRVRWSRGGRSLYFEDPDRNVIELASPGIWTTY